MFASKGRAHIIKRKMNINMKRFEHFLILCVAFVHTLTTKKIAHSKTTRIKYDWCIFILLIKKVSAKKINVVSKKGNLDVKL